MAQSWALDKFRLLRADRRHDPGGLRHALRLHGMGDHQCCAGHDRAAELVHYGVVVSYRRRHDGNARFTIGSHLRFHDAEMSQAELGQRIGVTRQTIAAIEAGKYSPSLEAAFRHRPGLQFATGGVFQWDAKATH